MTNISVFYVDYHVMFYIYSCTMLCLKFLRTAGVLILCFSELHYVICGKNGLCNGIVLCYNFSLSNIYTIVFNYCLDKHFFPVFHINELK
ncbi:hypothetical protein Hanom_Chr11g01027201 [Helianthus anomalus]